MIRRLGAGALVALALSTAACASDDHAAGDRPVTLTLVTHDSFSLSESVLEEFTATTGIEVDVLQAGDAGTMVSQAVLTKDDPIADVMFGIDSTFLSRALDEELFVPHEADGLDRVPAELVVDEKHRVTPVDVGDVCLNVDVEAFSDERPAPTSLAELTDPAYEDLLVVENPATSSPGLAFLLATIEEFGEDGYLGFWQSLRDNGVEIVDGWEAAYYGSFSGSGGSSGTRPIVVSYASSPAAEVIYADPPVDRAPTAFVPGTCYRQIEFAGVLRGTPHPDEAGRLVDFLLSDTVQRDLPLQMFVYPAVRDTELPPEFVEYSAIPDDPYVMSPKRVAAGRDAWIDAWTDTMLR